MNDKPLPYLGNLTPAEFLRDYWQKKPLLVRNAFPDIANLIEPDELAGLSMEEGVETRIIIEKGKTPWELQFGPFAETTFQTLPKTHWTLLVQAVDHYLPDLGDYLEHFNFIPNWRVDDIMISYAPEGGSVGPHYDQYDVFLIQGVGQRRWQLGQHCDEHTPRVEGTKLRIVQNMEVNFDEVLNPGDMLYVPPGLAHNGVAQNDCMTYSVGFRAPALAHVLERVVDQTLEATGARRLYADPGLALQANPGLLSEAALEDMRQQALALLQDPARFREALAPFLSEAKYDDYEPQADELTDEDLLELLASGAVLRRDPASRFLYTGEAGKADLLYVNGQALTPPAGMEALGALLADRRRLNHAELEPWLDKAAAVAWLAELTAEGLWFPEYPDDDAS